MIKSRLVLALAGLAAAGTVVLSGCALPGTADAAHPPVTSNSVPEPDAEPTVTVPDTTEGDSDDSADEPEATNYTPKKSDVSVTLKRKSKACFGSAGCNVEMEPRVTLTGSTLPSEGTLTVYYKISGGEDGAIEGSADLDLSEGTYEMASESISTRHSSTKITVKVTEVEFSEY